MSSQEWLLRSAVNDVHESIKQNYVLGEDTKLRHILSTTVSGSPLRQTELSKLPHGATLSEAQLFYLGKLTWKDIEERWPYERPYTPDFAPNTTPNQEEDSLSRGTDPRAGLI